MLSARDPLFYHILDYSISIMGAYVHLEVDVSQQTSKTADKPAV
jgi:hypothetical protein